MQTYNQASWRLCINKQDVESCEEADKKERQDVCCKEQKGGSLTNKSQRKLLSYASVIPETYEENDNDRSQDNTHFDAQKFEKEEITEIK